jgi:hypothetical protein
MILLLSVVAAVAEIIIYFVVGLGLAFSNPGDAMAMQGWAMVCMWIFLMTLAAGISAPLCAFIELATKKENIGAWSMLAAMVLAGVGSAALLVAGQATTLQIRQEQHAATANDRQRITGLKPEDQREELRRSYLELIQKENSFYNGVTSEVAKTKRGYELWARHEFFTQYSLSTGDDGKKISNWMADNRDLLKSSGINRVGVKGTGAYASWAYYDVK